MSVFKTLRTQKPSFSLDEEKKRQDIEFHIPTSWQEMTPAQYIYALKILALIADKTKIKTLLLCRYAGIHVFKKYATSWKCFFRYGFLGLRRHPFILNDWMVQSLLHQLDYIDSYEAMDRRLDSLHSLHAVDIELHAVPFVDFLNMEKYYQAYIVQKDARFLGKLGKLLYRRKNGDMQKGSVRWKEYELLNIFMWYSRIKSVFAEQFPYFFKSGNNSEEDSDYNFVTAMNAQIRALTDGDITKEKEVLHMDTWRALTELNEKAREADEMQKRLKDIK